MYIPSHFRLEDPALIRELMRNHPFATLISGIEREPFATHLPILVEGDEQLVLRGHVAKANMHWKVFDGYTVALAIFHGPHAYISPRLYETRPNVPTWNYATVHAYGKPVIVSDPDEALAHVLEVVRTFDEGLDAHQPESFDETYLRKMLNGIVAFRMPVERIEAKLKLNQNKTGADWSRVADAMTTSSEPHEQEVGQLMERIRREG